MTPKEQELIDGLISRIRSTPVEHKDTEAEQHIQQGLQGYGDALYVLVQTVLVQQYGLENAQSQLTALKQQNSDLEAQAKTAAQQQKSTGGSFLSHLFGTDTPAPVAPAQTAGYQPVSNQGYSPVANPGAGPGYPGNYGYPAAPPPYPAPGGLFGGGGMGGGGFLRGALQTAAGVAAGEMVFRGMEDLFSGFGGHHEGYREFGGGGGETVVNNYYDDDGGRGRDDTSRNDDSGFYNPDRDASRDLAGDNSQQGFLSDSNDAADDTAAGDDFSSGDDNLGFDDSGSNDDSSF